MPNPGVSQSVNSDGDDRWSNPPSIRTTTKVGQMQCNPVPQRKKEFVLLDLRPLARTVLRLVLSPIESGRTQQLTKGISAGSGPDTIYNE